MSNLNISYTKLMGTGYSGANSYSFVSIAPETKPTLRNVGLVSGIIRNMILRRQQATWTTSLTNNNIHNPMPVVSYR